jgi:magnesium transporter
MAPMFRQMQKKAGLAPGTVVYLGERRAERMAIRLMDFSPEHFREEELAGVGECLDCRDTDSVTWINIDGLHETDALQRLCQHFGVHALVQEDIVNTSQRPKFEDYEDHVYIVCRMITYDESARQLVSEQISLVVGESWVLSFQERPGDVFDAVRERARQGKGRLRRLGPDYLAYALLDAVVDHYFVVLEQIGDSVEGLEAELLDAPTPTHLAAIHAHKREMVVLRRSARPLREVAGGIVRDEQPLITESTRLFFRDLYDHTIQVSDAIESLRDILSSLQDLYLSSVSNRMNEIMKVLTIMGSIFIPLTFVAGIYGMNFAHMPELQWRWSYPLFWLVIVGLGGGLIVWFRRRGWL